MIIIPRLQRAGRSLTFPTVVQRASGGTGASTAAPVLTQPVVNRGCLSTQTDGGGFNVVSFNLQKQLFSPGILIATSAAT